MTLPAPGSSGVPEFSIYLSPPDVGELERQYLIDAFDSNWIAPAGPEIGRFEQELAEATGRRFGAALSSATAGLHLAMHLLDVTAGDDVIVPTLTFVASANVATYVGARPCFIDVSPDTWTLDPELLREELSDRARRGQLPAAVIAVDLYGQSADYAALQATCDEFAVPLVSDAAESLGATYKGAPAGSFGVLAALSFNGNKIITTSGGGMLVADDEDLVKRARYLSSQARLPVTHYEHTETGYNYRLSNLLAALGRAQLSSLPERIARRRAVNERYRLALRDIDGVGFMPVADYGTSNCWLTVITVDPDRCPIDAHELGIKVAAAGIEARPVWKPMHRQPLFAGAPMRGGAVSDRIFATGLCVPSGSSLSEADQQRVIDCLRSELEPGAG